MSIRIQEKWKTDLLCFLLEFYIPGLSFTWSLILTLILTRPLDLIVLSLRTSSYRNTNTVQWSVLHLKQDAMQYRLKLRYMYMYLLLCAALFRFRLKSNVFDRDLL